MKRAFLRLVAAWRGYQLFAAEIHADGAAEALEDAHTELQRTVGWLEVRAAKLKAAQVRKNLAVQALQRHERMSWLGLL